MTASSSQRQPRIRDEAHLRRSEHSVAVSVGGIPWMPSISVLVVKLTGKTNIQGMGCKPDDNRWSLYAESTILNNTRKRRISGNVRS